MANDCLSLDDFGQIEKGIPATLRKAAPLLVNFLNRADWPEVIAKALDRNFESLPAKRDLVKRNVHEFKLEELLWQFVFFFDAVEHCDPGSRFIDRAMAEQDCMCQ